LRHGPNAYRVILAHIRDRPADPFVIHCTAGKDRTGIICAIILRLAGLSDEDIATEYSLTEAGLGEWRKVIIEKLVADVKTRGDREGVENMVGSRKESMIAVLQMLDQEFGGHEGYARDYLGFS